MQPDMEQQIEKLRSTLFVFVNDYTEAISTKNYDKRASLEKHINGILSQIKAIQKR